MRFAEVASAADIDFVHRNGMKGERWILETVGSGVGVLDFDGDGRLDIWLVQGGEVPANASAAATTHNVRDRLFRNIGTDGELRFEDVTEASGVRATGYGMGIATGDIDNDGDADVFVANYGPNQLYENLGDGRFRELANAGVAGAEWSVSASFADVDGDGRLDLYVANYLDFHLGNHKDCPDLSGRPSYCAPTVYPALSDRLYRSIGDHRFEDASATAGMAAVRAPALGVVAHNFDGKHGIDFYVANDGTANHLWLNQGDGTFREQAQIAFAAFNESGAPEAGMGVDAEDFDGDCDVDLFVTHLATETNTLYINRGGWFSDDTSRAGLAASSAPYTGFGTGWFDADNDGDLDIFSANGAVFPVEAQRLAGDAYPLRQRNQLWLNAGDGTYREHRTAPALQAEEVSRGAAFADLDNDGDIDIVVNNNSGPPRLYRNDAKPAPWIGLHLPPGATATLAHQPCPTPRPNTDGSYASANDPRLLFPLKTNTPHPIQIHWPTGTQTTTKPLPANRYHRLSE